MPQLMPFYWIDSVFMVFYIIVTLVFFYYYKNMESVNELSYGDKVIGVFKFKW